MGRKRIGGRYRLLEARARGGMAAVWRARDEQTGDAVAVKVLHPHLTADEDARERLRREAEAMRTIEHPNVVAVRDVVVDGDAAAMVMDFVEGRSLAERLEDGPLPEAEALAVATDIADALAEAHEHGIIHRDVKPSNVLIGPDGRARLTDFGIAASLDDVTDDLTRADGVVGTLRYLAPERLLGEAATPATDVWGVGAILYEALAGEPAYAATSVLGRTDPDRDRLARPEGTAATTWAVIERAMAGDPMHRYADGTALAAALRGATASLASDVDPAAETMVIAIPEPSVSPSPTPSAASVATAPATARPSRAAAPIAAGLILAGMAVLAVLAGAGDGGAPADEVASPPAAAEPAVAATASPVATDAEAAPPKPDKGGKGGDKPGKGKGRGHGD